jgi:hypothetical protein
MALADPPPLSVLPAPEPLDLSAALAAGPPQRRAFLDLATFDMGRFGIGELLDLTDVVGVAPDKLGDAMRSGTDGRKGRVMVGIAWLIARRSMPGLTYDEVATWAIEVRGVLAGPTPGRRGPADHRPPSGRARGRRSS